MRILVSRAEFARRAQITPGGVTKACKKALAPATVGKSIDANHPAAITYIKNHTGDTTTVNGWTARNEAKKLEALEALKNEAFADMPLREVVKKYGTDPAFSDWVKAIKLIEDIKEKRLKNAETISELVNSQLVITVVVEPFDTAYNKLLTDGVKAIASSVTMMSDSGYSLKDCEYFVAGQISSHIKRMKAESIRLLQND